jgi:hypothetical protein
VPRTQITSAKVNKDTGRVGIGGPFTTGPNEVPLNIQVVVIQGGTYAYGQTAIGGSLRRPGWSCDAEIVGSFDVTKPAHGFGTLISIDVEDPQGAVQETFTWTEAVELSY